MKERNEEKFWRNWKSEGEGFHITILRELFFTIYWQILRCDKTYLVPYLCLPFIMPFLCYPFIGIPAILEGLFNGTKYLFLTIISIFISIIKCNLNHWKGTLILFREVLLQYGGSFGLVFFPCNICNVLYVDPDGEEAPNIHSIFSCCCFINGKRFKMLSMWPRIWHPIDDDYILDIWKFDDDRSSLPSTRDWCCNDENSFFFPCFPFGLLCKMCCKSRGNFPSFFWLPQRTSAETLPFLPV